MAKQTIEYKVGIYLRLSQEDMRSGESLSIEHQREIVTKYVSEQGWTIVDEYADDGYSGTDFSRPNVQRLLDDAQVGKINVIVCKDLSRFGRNYIEVGRYIDYIFPMYNIRFIALGDGIDTADRGSNAMEMMPIINMFNEWHASSTSKKIRAVMESNAKQGKYKCTYCAYGYTKADDEKNTPLIDPDAAEIVKRIFTMRSQGMSPRKISDVLNGESVPIPSDYYYAKIGKVNPRNTRHLWSQSTVLPILRNPIYIGHMAMMRRTTVSYKNHKTIHKPEDDWVVVENNHEPIISQELWDKVREVERSVSRGKRCSDGELRPLSGLMFCADCGHKMKSAGSSRRRKNGEMVRYRFFNCLDYSLFANRCFSHYISEKDIHAIICEDIRSLARSVITDEEKARQDFLSQKAEISERKSRGDRKKLNESRNRLAELNNLMQSVYEDKVSGKIPEDICLQFLTKYETERKELQAIVAEIEERLAAEKKDQEDVEEFIRRLKKYADVQDLTRELCLELIEYVTVGASVRGQPREIHIYYKFMHKPLINKNNLFDNENV